jgi:hypothetical protein
VQVTVTAAAVGVLDAEVLTALSVLTELSPRDTERALVEQGLARASSDPSPGHIWLDVAGLARLAAESVDEVDEGWQQRYGAMIAYAATKGWTDPDQTVVRAHVETAS